MSAVKNWACSIVLLLCCTHVLAQQPVLSVYNNGEYILTEYLYFYEDRDNSLTIDHIKKGDANELFKPLQNDFLTFGLTQSSLWFKIQLRYPQGAPNYAATKSFLYEVARAHLDFAELYIVKSDGSHTRISSDIRTDLEERPVVHINSVFPFEIALGEELTVYLQVRNRTGTFLPQTLWTPEAFATKVAHEEYMYGFFYGGMVIMLIYNFLLFASTKHETYLYYFCYLLGVLLFEFVDLGHGFAFFKTDIFLFHKDYIPMFFWILWLVGMRYTQHFLDLKERHPAINYVVNAYYFLSFFSLLIALEYDYYATVQYIAPFGGVAVLMVLALSSYVWYKGNENAAFFTYAWACNMGGFALFSSVVIGLLPAHPLLLFSMPVGTLLEAVVLSMALADRIKRAEKYKLDANQRAIENLSRYRSVFDNAVEGLYQMTLSGRLLNVNHAFARMLGYNSPGSVLQHSRNAVESLFVDPHRQHSQLAHVGWLNEEINASNQAGLPLNALHYAKVVRDYEGNALHIEGRLTDISDRKERERAQRERLKERRDKEVAKRATNSKSEFLRHMSHEIRTPLSAIIGYGECLRETLLSSQEKRHAVSTLTENAHKLLQLINNILDYSKIEADKLILEAIEVDLPATIESVHEHLQGLLSQKDLSFGVELEPPVPSHIICDPTRLRQILVNLCSNAIKFADKGGITVKLSWNGEQQRLCILIKDTGKGIDADMLARLQRSLSTSQQAQPPQGLGLTLAHRLAHLLGGHLTIESQVGQGTSVSIELPTTLPTQPRWIKTPYTRRTADKPLHNIPQLAGRVLLAEDNVVNQKLILRVIEKTGAEITVVPDGRRALNEGKKHTFDLILMDINMPVMGGLEATQKLRAWGYTKPIYALTAESGKDEVEACIAAGCNGHLSKPLELTVFYTVLAESLPHRDTNTTHTRGPAS